jgi:heme o synthase
MMTTAQQTLTTTAKLQAKARDYWSLIKSLQTSLLLITGLAGYMSARCPVTTFPKTLIFTGTLFLAISGSTILNMVYDRDIDAKMKRSCNRPIPSGRLSIHEALFLGITISALGIGGAFALDPLYGMVVFAGLFIDVIIYTMWLKRRTPWSIVWGGISGGMPIFAGRVLGTGEIEIIGILLASAVLLWIPTHIMTFGIKYADDYKKADVPTFANAYGERITRTIISVSTGAAVLAMTVAVWLIEINYHCFYTAIGLGIILIILTIASLIYPSSKLNSGLFKFASLYMLGTMALILLGV